MTVAPKIDVRDLRSVRNAAAEQDVVLGDDYVGADGTSDHELEDKRRRRGFITLNRSPLARKIITFNLLAIIILVAGVLYMNPSRDNLAYQRASSLANEAELIADVFEAQIPQGVPVNLITRDGVDPISTLEGLDLHGGSDVYVLDTNGVLAKTPLVSST